MSPLSIIGAIVILIVLFLSNAIKVVREYERGVIFRLGRLVGAKGPGLFLIIPILDKMVKISLRTITLDVPPQEVITKDNVSTQVNAVLFFRVVEPSDAVVQVQNYLEATRQIAMTTLRSVLGGFELDQVLGERETINMQLQQIVDEQTDPWGIKVTNMEIKDVKLPSDMQRAIARQAEAERDRRAKVINAEGELQAATKLGEAAAIIERKVRAFNPWPVTWCMAGEQRTRIWNATNLGGTHGTVPGTVVGTGKKGIDVATGHGILRLLELQRPGKRRMAAADYLNAGEPSAILE